MNQSESVLSVEWKILAKQTIAVTADFPSSLEENIQMGDGSEKSFRERVEEIREERKTGGTTEISDSEDSFREKVEEVRERRNRDQRGSLDEEVPIQVQWGIVGGAALGGGIIGAIANPMQPVMGFVVIAFISGGVAWAFATESGRKFREEVQENMDERQQQQQSSSSEPKQICSTCGWQNPQSNNYCHDCGEELKNQEQ